LNDLRKAVEGNRGAAIHTEFAEFSPAPEEAFVSGRAN